jgi:hypothetical protein
MNKKQFTELLNLCDIPTNETQIMNNLWNILKEINYTNYMKCSDWPLLSELNINFNSREFKQDFEQIKHLLHKAYRLEASQYN